MFNYIGRRVKWIEVTNDFFHLLFTDGLSKPVTPAEPIPIDSVIVFMEYDEQRKLGKLLIEHVSFPVVKPGDMIPTLSGFLK